MEEHRCLDTFGHIVHVPEDVRDVSSKFTWEKSLQHEKSNKTQVKVKTLYFIN